MACRLNDPGRIAAVAAPDASKTLGELLVEIANQLHGASSDYYVSFMVSTGGGLLEATVVARSMEAVAACLRRGAEGEKRGDEAAAALREASGEVPVLGVVEAYDMGGGGVERFTQLYRDALLSRKRSLYWLAGFEEDEEKQGEESRRRPAGETRLALNTIEDPDLFMARVALTSRIIRYTRARDPLDIHREAKELSEGDPDALYRLVVMLRSDESINVFYLSGRPCLLIRFRDDIAKASPVGGDVVEILGDIDKGMIEHVSLQRIDCSDCLEKVRPACLRIPERAEPRAEPAPQASQAPSSQGQPGEKAEKREEGAPEKPAKTSRWRRWLRR